MNKAEIIRALEPFNDEIEIVAHHEDRFYETDWAQYGMRRDGEGVLVIGAGARIVIPKIKLPE